MATLLECRYSRRFGNPWAFVEYAPAENLGLDFTAFAKQPPRETPRPQGDPAKHPHPARSRGRKVAIIAPRDEPRGTDSRSTFDFVRSFDCHWKKSWKPAG